VLVSAGGGIVGDALFRAAVDAHVRLRLPMRIVAGPFLPEPQWQALQALAAPHPGIALVRHVGDLAAEMRAARASVSQCGYNTALDIVAAEVPALVVPYDTVTENEQRHRAQRLAALGAVLCLEAEPLDGATLAQGIEHLLHFCPKPAAIATDGAPRSAQWLHDFVSVPQALRA
jgi:predicted glycosyltransferase